MPDENVKTAQEIIEEAKKAPKTPQLSEEFFQELLNAFRLLRRLRPLRKVT